MLTFIGVGPGDAELMTLKAARLLREADAIALPNHGTALEITRDFIAEKPLLELELPMSGTRADWEAAHERAAAQLLEWLGRYPAVAFPVLGDPGIYATSSYLYRRIAPQHPCAIVPGVPAMCAAAAALGMPLCEQGEPLTVLDRLGSSLPDGNVVLMKAGKHLPDLQRVAGARQVFIARNLGMQDEWLGPLSNLPAPGKHYFTTALIQAK